MTPGCKKRDLKYALGFVIVGLKHSFGAFHANSATSTEPGRDRYEQE